MERISKVISNSGYTSRRNADLLRQVWRVTWNRTYGLSLPARRYARFVLFVYRRIIPFGAYISMVSCVFVFIFLTMHDRHTEHSTLISPLSFLKPDTRLPQLEQYHDMTRHTSFVSTQHRLLAWRAGYTNCRLYRFDACSIERTGIQFPFRMRSMFTWEEEPHFSHSSQPSVSSR